MDCNKEEAIQARGIAEKMMGNRDFVGAKKFASYAQKLFPDLENITQMVLVCEVHCSAENKIFGDEKDWYGILKVEPTADDALIRKQYRMFALLLHPDKNKFPGAADAFSLICEAQSVLLDRPKHLLFNCRCISSGRFQVPMPRKSYQPDTRTHPWVQGTQSGAPGSQPTFRTACPFCSVKYTYNKSMLNKILWCDRCEKLYTGNELNDSDATPETSRSQPTSNQKKSVREETLARNPFMQSEFPSEVSQESNRNRNPRNAYGKTNKEDLSGEFKKKNTKRKKTSIESSENCDSSTSIDSKEEPGQNVQCLSEENQRRSTRCRQSVSYRDNLSGDDEEEDASKQSKGGGYPSPTEDSEVQHLSHAATPNGEEKKLKDSFSSEESLQNTEQEVETVNGSVFVPVNSAENDIVSVLNQVPEPEFYKFAAERSPEKFQIGQCWAIYSDEDALPRYYGQIKKIDRLPDFVLHVAWLYACPLPKSTIQWHDKTMPIGCGLFKFPNRKLNKYTVTNKFSHVVAAEPLKRGVYKIFPRTGEVWAVYKNWSAWLDSSKLEDFEYEIVEIVDVSDRYVDMKFLVRVNGFKSVYKPRVEEEEEEEEVQGVVKISVSEHLKFSHRIPAFRLTEERGGSLRGFWELDPAGMPLYLLCTD